MAFLADFSGSAVLRGFAAQAAASLEAGGAVGAIGVVVADSIVDAEAIFAALAGGTIGEVRAGFCIISVL